ASLLDGNNDAWQSLPSASEITTGNPKVVFLDLGNNHHIFKVRIKSTNVDRSAEAVKWPYYSGAAKTLFPTQFNILVSNGACVEGSSDCNWSPMHQGGNWTFAYGTAFDSRASGTNGFQAEPNTWYDFNFNETIAVRYVAIWMEGSNKVPSQPNAPYIIDFAEVQVVTLPPSAEFYAFRTSTSAECTASACWFESSSNTCYCPIGVDKSKQTDVSNRFVSSNTSGNYEWNPQYTYKYGAKWNLPANIYSGEWKVFAKAVIGGGDINMFSNSATQRKVIVYPDLPAPQSVTATPVLSQITLSWTKPSIPSTSGLSLVAFAVYWRQLPSGTVHAAGGLDPATFCPSNTCQFVISSLQSGSYDVAVQEFYNANYAPSESIGVSGVIVGSTTVSAADINRVENYDKFVKLFIQQPSNCAGVSKYYVYKSATSGSGYNLIGKADANTSNCSGKVAFHDIGEAFRNENAAGTWSPSLVNGTKYYYVVKSSLSSDQNSTASGEKLGVPLPTVSTLSDKNASSYIDVNWTAVSLSGWTVDKYIVVRWQGSSKNEYVSTTNSFHDSGAAADTLYKYSVKAAYYQGSPRIDANASYGAFVDGKITGINPKTPTDIIVVPGDANLEVKWTAPTATGVTGFEVYIFEPGNEEYSLASGDAPLPASTTKYTIENLTNGTTYSVKVRAKYSDTSFADSEIQTGIPAKATAYSCNNSTLSGFGGTPIGISIKFYNTGLSETWTLTTSKSYKVAVVTSLSSTTTYIDLNKSVAPGSNYFTPYWITPPVVSQDANFDVNYWMEKDGTSMGETCRTIVTAKTFYAVPQNLSATPDNGIVELFWDAPDPAKMKSASDLNAYVVYESASESFSNATSVAIVPDSNTSVEISGLSNDVNYYFRVKAKYDDGNFSAYSNQVGATPSADAGNQPNSACVSNTLVSSYAPGETVNAKATMKNTGNPDWNNAEGFKLKISGDYSTTKDLNSTAQIHKNQTTDFAFSFTTSSTPGTYDLNWKMFKADTAFGANCGDSFTVQSTPSQDECSTGSDCPNDNETCRGSPKTCQTTCADSSQIVQSHVCVNACDADKYCEDTCQTGTGVCLADHWNSGWTSTTVPEIADLQSKLDDRSDEDAEALLLQAQDYYDQGLLDDAQQAAQDGIDAWNSHAWPVDPYIILIVVVVGLLIVGAVVYLKARKGKGEKFERKEQPFVSRRERQNYAPPVEESEDEIARIKDSLKEDLEDEEPPSYK
ncbi:MAG: fibronectin type III domain-containing protein, partial [Candidatus Diapherotrites archaeon]